MPCPAQQQRFHQPWHRRSLPAPHSRHLACAVAQGRPAEGGRPGDRPP